MNNYLIKNTTRNYFIPTELKNIINLRDILNSINLTEKENNIGSSLKYYQNENNLIFVYKKFNPSVLEFIINHSVHFTDNEMYYLTEQLKTYDINDIVVLHTIELNLLLKLFNNKIIPEKVLYFYLTKLDYIPKDFLNLLLINIRKKKFNKKSGYLKNKNILQTNKNNYEFPRDIESLRDKEIKSMLDLINLPLVEIPLNKDNKNILEFLNKIYQLKNKLNLKKFNFSLRIKKTKKTKTGMFIVDTNTIIVDPRYPETFIHELGHYIYENKLAFTYNNKRYYPSLFKKHISKFKKNNYIEIKKDSLELYSDESEIFACFFENLLTNI